jgi:hypothetical protein
VGFFLADAPTADIIASLVELRFNLTHSHRLIATDGGTPLTPRLGLTLEPADYQGKFVD